VPSRSTSKTPTTTSMPSVRSYIVCVRVYILCIHICIIYIYIHNIYISILYIYILYIYIYIYIYIYPYSLLPNMPWSYSVKGGGRVLFQSGSSPVCHRYMCVLFWFESCPYTSNLPECEASDQIQWTRVYPPTTAPSFSQAFSPVSVSPIIIRSSHKPSHQIPASPFCVPQARSWAPTRSWSDASCLSIHLSRGF
jgi:hypothetical protein